MRLKPKPKLRVILLTLITLVTFSMFLLYFILADRLIHREILKNLKQIARFSILNVTPEQIKNNKSVKSELLIDFFLVSEKNNSITSRFHSSPEFRGHLSTGSFIKVCRAQKKRLHKIVTLSSGRYYFICSHYKKSNNLVVAVFSLNKILKKETTFKTIFLSLSVLIVLFILILSNLLLNLFVSRPLKRVYDSLASIDKLDPELLKPDRHIMIKEFGYLAGAIKEMAERIKNDRLKIANKLSQLELINKELERTQENLIKSEKLATIGELSAGIAHEIGNPLGVIMGYVAVLKNDFDISDKEKKKILNTVERSINRIKKIVNGLLDFARFKDNEINLCEVVSVVMEVVEFIKNQKRFKTITINVKSLVSKHANVGIPADKLYQVVLNLLINAADAFSASDLKIEKKIDISIEQNNKRIDVHVKDNGVGISKEIQEKIFKPFYTTKGKHGSGLGLTVSRYILHQYGAYLTFESKIHEGTKFTVSLESKPVD